ncbi:hypothetical protein CB0940_01048 [Cercospora beticola]|uniref:Uncharacterized protein n=2 Tax=Cercospora beticola TaxID=122368 RepID=A0A2G5I7J2_CERBT|nr:hypothetical protein CB0940_01048 [Cercospora beticola]PIB00750.1 hypothetical protein CB0940_01048 [Cercospora beticola]
MSRSHRNLSKGSVTTMGGILARPQRTTPRTESIESQRRRNEAAEILQSYEQLSWYAYQRCETLTQTRIHFRCIVAGITPEQEEANVHWREDFPPRPVEPLRQSTSSCRGKERVSSGSGADPKEMPLDAGPSTSIISKEKTVATSSSSRTSGSAAGKSAVEGDEQ